MNSFQREGGHHSKGQQCVEISPGWLKVLSIFNMLPCPPPPKKKLRSNTLLKEVHVQLYPKNKVSNLIKSS